MIASGSAVNNQIKAFVSTRLTKGVSVVFDRRDRSPFIVVRGPNGAGKSTLLRAFIGLDEGGAARLEESFDDHTKDYFPQKDRAFIRYMPQDPGEALFPNLSVGDNIRLLSQLLRIPRNFADSIGALQDDGGYGLPLRSLSMGEKKLLLLEAILCSLPAPGKSPIVFALLDEPFAGLHPSKSKIFLEKLNEKAAEYINNNNVTFLIVDHDHINIDVSDSAPIAREIIISHLERLTFPSTL
jgi:ABC-type multidrug transport system ATPase subunit